MNLPSRLTILEQRTAHAAARTAAQQPAPDDFDFAAYAAAWEEARQRSPEDLAAECVAELAAPLPRDATGEPSFDYRRFTIEFYALLAGNPPDWAALLTATGGGEASWTGGSAD